MSACKIYSEGINRASMPLRQQHGAGSTAQLRQGFIYAPPLLNKSPIGSVVTFNGTRPAPDRFPCHNALMKLNTAPLLSRIIARIVPPTLKRGRLGIDRDIVAA